MLDTVTNSYVDEWPTRCAYWQAKADDAVPKRKRRERNPNPLILTGQGLSVRVDKGCLLIRDGNTHHPPPKREWRFFKGSLDIPQRLVLVDGSGSITLDALDWLGEQGVKLIRIKFDGSSLAVTASGGYSADREKVDWQRSTRADPEKRLAFAIETIRQKLEAALLTLEQYVPKSPWWDRSHDNISEAFDTLRTDPPGNISDVLGVEGGAAADYFRAWRGLEIKWKGETKQPIPDDWRTYTSRSALHTAQRLRNRHATHPVNAMLNYAYAGLLTSKQIEAIAEGYDPTIGVIHDTRRRDEGRTPAFALDLMEPERPVVDRVILRLIEEETFSGADFLLQGDGVVRLNPELARMVAQSVDAGGC